MTWNHPDDVPTSLTRRAYALRGIKISQNDYAAVVADAYEDVKQEVLRDLENLRTLKDDRFTPATKATAELLGLPVAVVAVVLEGFEQEAGRIARERREANRRTLTRDNADEIAAWVGGWLAGGTRELVGWGKREHVLYAHPGDTIIRRAPGKFEILKGEEQQ